MPKTMRARVREDERTLELVERLAGAAGLEVSVTLTGLPDEPAEPRSRVHFLVRPGKPIGRLTREEIYDDPR